tara:strand:- start:166 stop:303 length:138 start_codon:yes stop_codon:yes gene_type:complete
MQTLPPPEIEVNEVENQDIVENGDTFLTESKQTHMQAADKVNLTD